MKLSLDEKTLIIIGIFAICLLFLNNLNEDDKRFKQNMIEEETRDLFQNTTSNNKNNKSNNKGKNNNSKEEGPNNNQIELEEGEQVEEKEERETAMKKYKRLITNNKNKVQGIKDQSEKYYKDIRDLHDRNTEEKKIQEGIITNLIEGKEHNPETNFDSYLTYNGTLLRNSLLNTASNF